MPRGPRLHAPHSLHHLIGRFLNREHLLCGPQERREYLRRVTDVLTHTDTRPLGYALMSSHTHWVCLLGAVPPRRFIQPLHGGFGTWYNRRSGRLGPLFAGRFTDVVCPQERTALLLAYVHNNPVRAGVIRDPAESDWTSHRAYLGIASEPALPWLDVAAGLCASGFDASPSGRAHFHDFVLSQRAGARDPVLSGGDERESRRRARLAAGGPCEISDAMTTAEQGSRREVVIVPGGVLRPRWPGEATDVVDLAAVRYGLEAMDLRSRSRRRDVVEARRLALWLWTRELGRSLREMAGVLGLADSSASELLRSKPKAGAAALGELGMQLWRPCPEQQEADTS